MNQPDLNEVWQAEVGGQIYESNLEALTQWIYEGSLQPNDKVRRGNLRWIEARRVPPLIPFFNAKENGFPPPLIMVSVTNHATNQNNAHKCAIHTGSEPSYKCETCVNSFCESCISPIYNPEKLCPMCGAKCISIGKTTANFTNPPQAFPLNNSENNFAPSTTNNFDQPQYVQRFPSDVVETTKRKGMGLFSIAIISVLSASVIAYLWAYQFYSPNKTVEDALPEIVSLDEKYKSEYLDAQNLQNRSKESNKPKFNLKDINKTSIEPGTTVKICRNGDGQKIPCNPLLKEFPNGYFEQQKEQKKHFEEVQEFEKIQEKVLDRENIVYFFTEGALIKTKHEEERTKILENYRATQSYNSFIFTFFLSFTALVASLWLIVGRR